MALAGKRLDRLPYRVWVLCGDSEMAEGSMWEAFEHAAHYELDNLTAILDVNRLGQRGETMIGWDLDVYVERARAFGWHAIAIDGHDLEEIDAAYAEATATTGKPTVVIARTIKGKGVAAVENRNGFHGKPLDDPEAAIAELGGPRDIRVQVAKPESDEAHRFPTTELALPRYELGADVATRKAYGEALAAVGSARGDVVALDGEVSNSTFAEIFAKAHPERYFEMYIAEQQLVAAAVGLQARGWRPFASTFAAFLSRAYDFVRMAAISRASFVLSGLARGRLDRGGRSLADGARGHRRVSRRARKRRPPPVRRESDRSPRGRARRPRRDRVHPDPAPRDARPVRRRTRSSRSAGVASCARRRRTTSPSSPPGSPCTRRWRQRTRSPARGSPPA